MMESINSQPMTPLEALTAAVDQVFKGRIARYTPEEEALNFLCQSRGCHGYVAYKVYGRLDVSIAPGAERPPRGDHDGR